MRPLPTLDGRGHRWLGGQRLSAGDTGNVLRGLDTSEGVPFGDASDDASDGNESAPPTRSGVDPDRSDFDWRGWTLVAAIVVAFFVVPVAILYLPAARSLIQSLGLSLRDAYLVLPLVPAFGLGALAVWSAIRTRST